MSQRELIKTGVNPQDFLKIILNVGDFTRQFKSRYYVINAGHYKCKYWEIRMYGLKCNAKILYIDLSYCKKDFRNLS